MKLPRRRRGRPHGTPRLASVNDTRAAEDARQWLSQIQTDPANGTTWHQPAGTQTAAFGGASDIGVMSEPVTRPRPAAILPMAQARAVMKVYPPGPGVPAPTPQALEVARFLRAKVIILKRRGHVDRISDDKLAMLPCDRIRNRRTTARLIVDEAAELLLCGGDPS
jgi:hypothetical protein